MIRILFLAAGFGLFVYLLLTLDPTLIAGMLWQVGARFLLVVFIYGLYEMARAAALLKCLDSGSAGYWDVLRIRFGGEAVEFLTFTGPFLAEPTKAWLLKKRGLNMMQALAATLTEYLIYLFTSSALSLVGLLYLVRRFDLSQVVHATAWVLIAAMSVFLSVSAWAIVARIYLIGAIIHRLSRLPLVHRCFRPDMQWISGMEDVLFFILRDSPWRFLGIVVIQCVAQGLLIAELYWILRAFDPEIPLLYSFAIESATKFVTIAFFFVPARIGAAEGAYVLIFEALGLVAVTGFTVAFMRRLRSLLAAGVGLLILWWFD